MMFGDFMKRILLSIILALNITCCAYGEQPQINAASGILMDIKSGQVLWEKNATEPMAMASTTKIMTATIALEMGNLEDTVCVSERASQAPPVKMHLSRGENISLENLLYAMMLESANDSAVAIAEHIAGSVEEFATLMNNKARELGCKDTVFVTPNGLDSGDHHSTAYDMALITRYALNNDKFAEIINTRNISFSSDKKAYSMVNKNRLLNEYEGAFGVKTGFTGKAGHCFVGAARREDSSYISVVLASGWGSTGKAKKWSDTKEILNYGFDNFQKKVLYEMGYSCGQLSVENSKVKQVELVLENDVTALINKDGSDKVDIIFSLPESLIAPVEKNQTVGLACVRVNGQTVGNVGIATADKAEKLTFTDYLKKIFENWLNIL